MGRRRQSREAALKLLYALDITRDDVKQVVRTHWAEAMMSEEIRVFTTTLVTGDMLRR